eukprot:CAMPEP_0202826264 /NCGR_PEP_ID=MMETSP1389-20130828/13498_1 /ASSEMBLY_ACC=CAM_ASM_000865 /TAXON_ID=302021 /ORGANISM="Rhodomonas sp., Strain CCMP768" /LENGTH=96 /DNA_ID=CAMNT_0049499541 /DNA_START=242 /DNA_END=532 /DNA_ORIENTATION=-
MQPYCLKIKILGFFLFVPTWVQQPLVVASRAGSGALVELVQRLIHSSLVAMPVGVQVSMSMFMPMSMQVPVTVPRAFAVSVTLAVICMGGAAQPTV